MTHRVVIQRLAKEDLQAAYQWAADRAPLAASVWLGRLQTAIEKLEQFPDRCPLAREHGKVDAELRELLVGKRPYVFRVVFVIDAAVVQILRIRRAQRRVLTRAELKQALDLHQ